MATTTCGVCQGSGRVHYRIINPPKEWDEDCSACGGTGQVEVRDE